MRGTRAWVIFGVIGFALAGAITFALQSGSSSSSGGGPTLSPSNAIARAAYVTSTQQGFKFTMNIDVNAAGHNVTMTGNGAIAPPGRGTLQMNVGPMSIQEIIDAPSVYMKMPLVTGALASTPWVKVNAGAMMKSMGFGSPLGGSGDPTMMLGYLKAAGGVTKVGSESVDGVSTTHYHVSIDLNRYASVLPQSQRAGASTAAKMFQKLTGQSTLPMEVWVDSASRLRRMQMQLSMSTAAGSAAMTMDMRLFDYGTKPVITPPPADQVTDITSKIGSAGGLLGQLGG
jgi:hypothetical protein